MSGLGWDADGLCDDHNRFGCEECALSPQTLPAPVNPGAILQADQSPLERSPKSNGVRALKRQTLPAPGGGTWASIAQWCEDTFGPVTMARTAERANEEMQELLAEPENVIEAADVCIVLSRYPGLWDAVQRKMAINRARTWDVRGDGTGYHVKAEGSSVTPEKPLATVAAANDEGVNFRALLIEAGRNAGALLDDRVSDDFLKGIPEEVRLKIERLREDTRTIQRNTATYRQEARAEADAAIERAAEANKRADNMAEANRRLLAMFEADPTSRATSRSQHEGASSVDQGCKVPPEGWWCSRSPGHEGPCAARQIGEQ